jgi:hypothetical protein
MEAWGEFPRDPLVGEQVVVLTVRREIVQLLKRRCLGCCTSLHRRASGVLSSCLNMIYDLHFWGSSDFGGESLVTRVTQN